MDVVWLKRDVRLHDHGPLAEAIRSYLQNNDNRRRCVVLLYLFEPDQLREPTVHGSHLRFVWEGLVDLERQLRHQDEVLSSISSPPLDDGIPGKAPTFQYLTVCHNTAVATLQSIHQKHPIRRLLAHEETGHWKSYMRDRAVRRWCRDNHVVFVEYNQTGVTRCLKNRDDYSKHWKACMAKPRHPTPSLESLRTSILQLPDLPGFLGNFKAESSNSDQWAAEFTEIPAEHRNDRCGRQQYGGETKAIATLNSFLQERGSRFSQDISSPNTAWNSCSRLSPYLAWGHISLRYILYMLQQRQEAVKKMKAQGRNTGTWLKSLQAFSSRLHWRSHFVQKLESEPTLELRDLCPAYQHLRRQDGDWVEELYVAWATGTTGFPFVDACMRCLLQHGWMNFRMRAMLVSFACYNLWLDWKRIAPHLARVFLDFEPGIHYPQLQMQAGTTGINAMRVYNVTKQGKDQDLTGKFIRKYVKELQDVPDMYIHEPWRMPKSVQEEAKVTIVRRQEPTLDQDVSPSTDVACYPEPIVNEQESARTAKARLSTVRKQEATKTMANDVFVKHGSRNHKSHEMNGRANSGAAASLPAVSSAIAKWERQPKISDAFGKMGDALKKHHPHQQRQQRFVAANKRPPHDAIDGGVEGSKKNKTFSTYCSPRNEPSTTTALSIPTNHYQEHRGTSWDCTACTYRNEHKPYALVCGICGTNREG